MGGGGGGGGGHNASKERLVSLDVFRGLTVADVLVLLGFKSLTKQSDSYLDSRPVLEVMILVDDAGGVFPAINHSPWDGVTLADFVMPFFLFMVGVSLALTFKQILEPASVVLDSLSSQNICSSAKGFPVALLKSCTRMSCILRWSSNCCGSCYDTVMVAAAAVAMVTAVVVTAVPTAPAYDSYWSWREDRIQVFPMKVSCRFIATRKAFIRALKLFLLGLLLQGGYFHGLNDLSYGVNIEYIRWMGTLQRIAIAYLAVALCEIWLKNDTILNSKLSLLRNYRLQWMVVIFLCVMYTALLYGLTVPDWEYQVPSAKSSIPPKTFLVTCGKRGETGPACNAVGMIDRRILGIQHLYNKPIYRRTKHCSINSPDYGPLPSDAPSWCQAPFEPEGLLSSLMAVVTCLIGLHYGHIIVLFKDHKVRILQWTIPASSLVVIGFAMDFLGMHANKVLYTFSYTCITAGAAGLIFAGIYVLVDVCGYRRPSILLEWMGTHSLTIYVLVACNVLLIAVQGFYWKKPQNNFFRLIGIGSH
ncbi:hypothetical protein GIB67_038348 [Kingdonia uniflora]|uniref:Heparan-alpha-glucosaminide N-acetyltransferase n=1 Tax=Kingdonia uniflora TaxID=39325 RepID=A0A7J7KUP9_9MAGN|nr:hypothetical protein GIB67_038348 [Kingdonia uniflora]